MKQHHTVASALLAASLLFSMPAQAASREVTVFSAVSAASGSSTAERTAGYPIVRFQACGTGFSGTVTALQGTKSTTTTATKTVTLTLNSDCTSYYVLNPSAWTGFSYTRSAGTLTLYLELAP